MNIIDDVSEKVKDVKDSAIDSGENACNIPDSFAEKAKDFGDEKIENIAESVKCKIGDNDNEGGCCGGNC